MNRGDIVADDRLIIALDYSTMGQVKKLVEQLGDTVTYYKVGMELFYSVGQQVVSYLRERDKEVFLDLKLHDIPNTVAKSAASLTRLGVSMFNCHASGGALMMKAAAEAVAEQAQISGITKPKLIAVTVLTSVSSEDWGSLNYSVNIEHQVLHLAKMAQDSGLDGVVSSAREAQLIRSQLSEKFLIVTPGIRPAGSSINDQNRIASPIAALNSGASHLVVGRPVTAAHDPSAAVESILNEIGGSL